MSDADHSDRKRKKFFKPKGNKKGKHGGENEHGKPNNNNFKNRKRYELQAGMVGFLATLNDHQHKQATTELLNILPDFLPDLAGDSAAAPPSDGISPRGDDIAAMLAAENATANLLAFCDTKVPNIIFIRLPNNQLPNVNLSGVVSKIYESVEAPSSSTSSTSPRQISRYVNRLVPVMASCPAYVDRITKCLRETLASYFASLKPEELAQFGSFSLCFKSTYNQSINRQELEDILICHMASIAPTIRMNRSARDRVIVIGIHIVKTVCCISLLRDYYRFAKYNLAEFQLKQSKNAEEEDEKAAENKDS